MGRLTCFGKTIVDFLNLGTVEDGPLKLPEYRQFPGGAPANVAVAFARLGGESAFAGQVGNDAFGRFLTDALDTYQVDTRALQTHATAKTAAAFITLNEQGERSFDFYRQNTADIALTSLDVQDRWFMNSTFFHAGSNTLTDEQIAQTTVHALTKAKKQGCITCFDVNLRPNLWPNQTINTQAVLSALSHVDILKLTKDELLTLCPEGEMAFVKQTIQQGVSLILMTDGPAPVKVLAKGIYSEITPPSAKAADTTAAGDAFMGGFLFALSEQSDIKKALSSQNTLEEMVLFASKCGAYAVTKQGAFTAMPTLDELEAHFS